MATIFTKIIRGEIPCYKISESEDFFAFLDINPVQKGHTLVIPKKEVDYIFDLSDDDLANMMAFSKRVAKAIKEATNCTKVAMTAIGLEVPHAHIHLVPIWNEGDLDFRRSRTAPTDEEQKEVQRQIISYL